MTNNLTTQTTQPQMRTARAYGAPSASEPLVPLTIERRDVGPREVLIDIKFCGICHSDIHHCRGEWGEVPYPAVPGHEIAGIVREVGAEVTRHVVGDRVGVGGMVDSCRECENCRTGQEQYCLPGRTQTYGSADRDGTVTRGGYWGAGPGRRVAVVGLGGLGHMAVQIAHVMGAEVTVLSQSLRKQDDGLRLGADAYHATSDPETFEKLAGRFDLIVNTVSAPVDVSAFLGLLVTDGVLVNLGAPPEPLPVGVFSLLAQRRSFAGSLIGSIRETQEMLDFCAEHGIGAEIEVIGADRINEAWERMLVSDVRYRFVIDTATLEV